MTSSPNQQYETRAGLAQFDAFMVAGTSIITNNEKGADDINALWQKFFEQQLGQKLENHKEDDTIYAVYSDYEGDHTKPYRLTIGYKLQKQEDIPSNLHQVTVESGEYAMLAAAGEQPKALIEGWEAIWSGDLDRTFKTDFEIYGPRFFEEGLNEVLICVGVTT